MLPPELSQPLLLGTSNSGKLFEITRFACRLGFEVTGLSDPQLAAKGPPPEISEVADTYAGNAYLKGMAYAKHFSRPCLADDTGLEIPLLGYLPGIYTARWGLARVVKETGAARCVSARFVCAMAFVEPSGRHIVTHGTIEGELRDMSVPAGTSKPLPFGDFFYPFGSSEPLGKLVGNGFEGSHRFQALAALVRALS